MDSPHPLTERIVLGFEDYRRRFGEISRRASDRFEQRAWSEGQDDARARILLYDTVVHETLQSIRDHPDEAPPGPDQARSARDAFAEWARGRPDSEIAETFYNSVVRRLHGTVGVDPDLEFVGDRIDDPDTRKLEPWSTFPLHDDYATAIGRVLDSLPFAAPWHQRDRRVERAAALVREVAGPEAEWRDGQLEVLRPTFFRNKAAYIVGRMVHGERVVPLVFSLLHPPEGIVLDLKMPRADVADYLCLSIETVSRTLTHMCQQGLLRRDGPFRLLVTDRHGLHAMACAD